MVQLFVFSMQSGGSRAQVWLNATGPEGENYRIDSLQFRASTGQGEITGGFVLAKELLVGTELTTTDGGSLRVKTWREAIDGASDATRRLRAAGLTALCSELRKLTLGQ